MSVTFRRQPAGADLLNDDADTLVNPVNTVGVMGAGLAAQFKRTWPAMATHHQQACRAGLVQGGSMHVWRNPAWEDPCPSAGPAPVRAGGVPRLIVNFPTKKHWRHPSRLEYVTAGLVDLVEVVRRERIHSLAVPALGCGLGGLDRRVVLQRLVDILHAGLMLGSVPKGDGAALPGLPGKVEVRLYGWSS